ncbi:metallophosphoesterase [Sansalvadorimonas sp. 2012CJ34-2]|uniref:Metallophosphoesterase n=1 Tax=Parendozoicomonas callyspongiae TaxID=2942213 RepID=A0ABT0PIU6_9GAMM|nr:metallophosphoesterase [Sansalvadorimonas sp. 2012CJ34-2]MCL6271275.1 metallophosphoesterase [Sansalvadorimonas sp. 2012CJ34-2]
MTKKHIVAACAIAASISGCAAVDSFMSEHYVSASDAGINDGPYVFIEQDNLLSARVANNELTYTQLPQDSFPTDFPAEISSYKSNGTVAVLSDIHGQHNLFITLLKNNNIIDEEENWSFGDGHFVITGDIFDRGPNVIESLWLVMKLEKQAEMAGGKVHYLLGNHEYMVLLGDERYLNDKYLKTAELFKQPYKDLFNQNTVLGRWLRSKATVIKIDDTIYTHGGLSPSFSKHKQPLDLVNNNYRITIDMPLKEVRSSPKYGIYHNRVSPVWYRGYFSGELTVEQVADILKQYGAKRIVVGHTPQNEIKKLSNGQIFAVDTSIQTGESGQILFFKNDVAIRAKLNGEREPL